MKITEQIPKIDRDFRKDAVFELGIGIDAKKLAIQLAVEKSTVCKPLNFEFFPGRDVDTKLGFKHLSKVAVLPHLKSSEQNRRVPVVHVLKRFELPKETTYVAVSDFVVVVHH